MNSVKFAFLKIRRKHCDTFNHGEFYFSKDEMDLF